MRRSNASLDKQATGTDGSRSRPGSPNPPLASVPASPPAPPLKANEAEVEGSRPGTGVSTKEGSAVHFGDGVSGPRAAAREDGHGHGNSGGQSLKRAARKLSFSTAFMGLGKKDKERGEKKDKSRPPSSPRSWRTSLRISC